MKKFSLLSLALLSTSLFAATPQFGDLSKEDVKDVAREFSSTFSHTGVSAPETDGYWGIEVGVLGGQSATPKLEDVVDASGGKGSDFKHLYHAGLVGRVHIPFDFFFEASLLPEQTISDVKVKNKTFELGWNLGSFFNLPLDLAVGANVANSDISFKQDATVDVPVDTTVAMNSKTRILWVGVSRSFLFFTPYLKLGTVSSKSDVKTTNNAEIFNYTGSTKDTVNNSGSYLALGANLQFFIVKFGVETSRIMNVSRHTAKLSFDF